MRESRGERVYWQEGYCIGYFLECVETERGATVEWDADDGVAKMAPTERHALKP